MFFVFQISFQYYNTDLLKQGQSIYTRNDGLIKSGELNKGEVILVLGLLFGRILMKTNLILVPNISKTYTNLILALILLNCG